MAVLKVTGNWEGLGADAGADGAEVPQYFDVTFDNNDPPEQRPLLAWSATDGTTSVPALYSPHPYNSRLFVRRKNVDPVGPFHFRVNVYYSTRPVTPAGDEQFDPFSDPLEQPWEVEWDSVETNEPVDRDIHDRPILNSVGESYDPAIMRPVRDRLLTIRRNEGNFNYLQADDYENALNADTFYGFAPGIVRCIKYSGRRAFTGVMFYWQVTYAFQMRRDGWLRRILDQGYRTKVLAAGGAVTVEAIEDDVGNKVSQPWPLNGEGYKLSQAAIDAGTAFWREHEIFRLLPFSVLALE